jgi:hypothetical protein
MIKELMSRVETIVDSDVYFNVEVALVVLLLEGVLFTNCPWNQAGLSHVDQGQSRLIINCSDVFDWGCADGEPLLQSDIELLYKMWKRDPSHGSAVFTMIMRNMMPQPPVEKQIRESGLWDLDSLILRKNDCPINLASKPFNGGTISKVDFHDAIDQWHESNSTNNLHVYIGFTWDEYRKIIENKIYDITTLILSRRELSKQIAWNTIRSEQKCSNIVQDNNEKTH